MTSMSALRRANEHPSPIDHNTMLLLLLLLLQVLTNDGEVRMRRCNLLDQPPVRWLAVSANASAFFETACGICA